MHRASLAFVVSTLVLGCSASPDTGSSAERTTTAAATITFAKDWSVTETGTITPGRDLTFSYDLSRLSKCRLTEYGQPAWAILAYVSFDGGAPTELVLAPQNGVTTGVVETTIPTPIAKDVAFWFYASDDGGCTEWDSSYGQNFHFAIAKAQDPTIHFGSSWSTTVVGSVGPGTVLVDYDFSRATCKSTYNGNDAFGVTMYASVDGATPDTFDMTTQVGARRFSTAHEIPLPQGDHTLSIWFENSDVYGCPTWDSAYGANYVFSYGARSLHFADESRDRGDVPRGEGDEHHPEHREGARRVGGLTVDEEERVRGDLLARAVLDGVAEAAVTEAGLRKAHEAARELRLRDEAVRLCPGWNAELHPDVVPTRDGRDAVRVALEGALVTELAGACELAFAGNVRIRDECARCRLRQVTEIRDGSGAEGVRRVPRQRKRHRGGGDRGDGHDEQRRPAFPARGVRKLQKLRIDLFFSEEINFCGFCAAHFSAFPTPTPS